MREREKLWISAHRWLVASLLFEICCFLIDLRHEIQGTFEHNAVDGGAGLVVIAFLVATFVQACRGWLLKGEELDARRQERAAR